MGMIDAPAIHYNLKGSGRISINRGLNMQLMPHLLIIVPPNTPFSIEVDGGDGATRLINRDCWKCDEEGLLRVAVPNEQPEVVQICGFFSASFGQSVGLFRDLRERVVEQFEPSDKIDDKLCEAINELLSQEVGMGAMTVSLLKQVIIALARRSLKSSQSLTDRFSIIADRQITRAIAVDIEVTDELRTKIIEIANKCPVHRTLESSSVMSTSVGTLKEPPPARS